MKIFRLLLLILYFSVPGSEEYKIIRQPRDKFRIPSPLCTSKWRDKCTDMGGKTTRTNCTCQCKEGNKNIFGYFGNAWKCTSNHDLRRKFSAGCIYEHFHGENDTSLLKVVALNKVEFGSFGYLGSLSNYCRLESQISYLNCDGKWKQFNKGSTSSGFSFRGYYRNLYYRDKETFRRYRPRINGRVINLSLKCSASYTGEKQGGHCVLLKVKGKQNCEDTLPTISTPTTSTTTSKSGQTSPSTSSTTSLTTSLRTSSAKSSTTPTRLGQTSSITSSTTTQTTPSLSSSEQTIAMKLDRISSITPSTTSSTSSSEQTMPTFTGVTTITSSATSSTTAGRQGQTSSITSSSTSLRTSSATSSTTATRLGQTSSITSSTTSQATPSSSSNEQTITMKLGRMSSITSSTTSSTSSSEQTMPTAVTAITTGKLSSHVSNTASYPIVDISLATGRDTETTAKSQTSDAQIPNSPQEEERANTNDSSSGIIIGGTVVGVISLVIIILIGIIIRKKRFSQAKRDSVSPVSENPSYDHAMPMSPGRLQFPHNEYSYAYVDNHPVVIKEQNGRASSGTNLHHGNIKGVSDTPPSHSSPIYFTLEEPNYAKPKKPPRKRNVVGSGNQRATKQEPVYDVLEDRNSTSPNTDGPTYHTLEDPNYAKPAKNTREVQGQKHTGTKIEFPVYEGHEEPNSSGAPVHSVLEGPNTKDNDPHIYGSLDSPDPHLYGTLYYPTTKVASGYNNELYGSVNGTMLKDICQELVQTGLESSETGLPKNVLVMKNMSGVN